jgi:hypothetical protein
MSLNWGTVNGRDAWVITPDETTHRRGSVTFIGGGTQFIVEGNTHLSADELLKIAESIPVG